MVQEAHRFREGGARHDDQGWETFIPQSQWRQVQTGEKKSGLDV